MNTGFQPVHRCWVGRFAVGSNYFNSAKHLLTKGQAHINRCRREACERSHAQGLTGRLALDFKAIANLRKDNGKSISGVCRQFVVLYQQLGLFAYPEWFDLDDSDIQSIRLRA